ncbi:hypothetical protein GCM10023321_05290 [Pseudonocardia eucalypti]|uniref:Major facilitator superfamily (MFS) profile domain-containing protein n=1 Tax=Pseudonocardia eucalypti TaxID=648755 RepID=A0ABP9PGF1_9PSEU|nr:putative MFS family arabinose efflux permease [Pseudonocardia eucalypti]
MTLTEQTPGEHRTKPVFLALAFVVLAYGLLQTMMVPTVALLARNLNTGLAAASWAVLTAPLLTSVLVTPLVGLLADRLGARRVLTASLLVYLVGMVGSGLAPGIEVLIGFRAVQGIGLALVPLSFVLAGTALPRNRVPAGLALCSGLLTGSAGAGLLLGGLLADLFSWRWIFVLGGLVTLAALGLSRWALPLDPRPSTPARPRPTPVRQRSAQSDGALHISTQSKRALRISTQSQGVPRRTNRVLLISHGGALLLGVHQFLCYQLVPGLSQLGPEHGGFGTTVTGAALILLPGTLITMPASWAAEPVARRLGLAAPLVLGLVTAALATASLAAWHAEIWQVVAGYLVCSVGYGLAMAALPRMVIRASTATGSGGANGANTVARVLGGALGSQLAVLTMTAESFALGFLLATAAAAAGVLVASLAAGRG